MRANRAVAAVAAAVAATLTTTVVPTHAATADPEPYVYTAKRFCKADSTTRVRLLVDNNAGKFKSITYAVTYSDGRREQYTTIIDKRPVRQLIVAATVPTDGTVTLTVGPKNSDTFDGTWARTVKPLDC